MVIDHSARNFETLITLLGWAVAGGVVKSIVKIVKQFKKMKISDRINKIAGYNPILYIL